jgi:hypothetical protein
MRKLLLTVSGLAVVLLASGSVAIAGGIGPFGAGINASVATIQNVFKGPETLPKIDPQTGCDSSATSTNCATVKTSQPAEQATKGLSTATNYTEVASTKQSGKIDEYLAVDNTLKIVSFCGTTLRTRQIIINGVDVAQRIAQLASSDHVATVPGGESIGQGICNSMPHNIDYTKGILEIPDVKLTRASSQTQSSQYTVTLYAMSFLIDSATNEIFNIGAYDGSLVLIGKLK